jgi:hypothetical protein
MDAKKRRKSCKPYFWGATTSRRMLRVEHRRFHGEPHRSYSAKVNAIPGPRFVPPEIAYFLVRPWIAIGGILAFAWAIGAWIAGGWSALLPALGVFLVGAVIGGAQFNEQPRVAYRYESTSYMLQSSRTRYHAVPQLSPGFRRTLIHADVLPGRLSHERSKPLTSTIAATDSECRPLPRARE